MSAKTEATNPAKLASFLRKHVPAGNALQSTLEPEGMDLVDLFVQSYMLWQAPSADAIGALKRLKAAFFDWNDLRVSLVSDIVDVIGHRHWRAADRVSRMRDAMNGIFRREHKVSLERLRTLMKRDAVNYMETLPGMIPFVANRVLLVGVDFHSVPVEEFGLQMLVQAGALPAGTSLVDASGWVTRHVKAEEAREAHRALVAAVDHMWETNPPKLPKAATKPAELAPPKPIEEARAAAKALVEAQLAAERAALLAERAARREEMRREKAALKAKEARERAAAAKPKASKGATAVKSAKAGKPAKAAKAARPAKVAKKRK
ncbi:MAG: hypothetical protein FGM39_01865 [Phycisphaerales bacterium]|nr:hypothetical protein [Phycisphaerales bacterium]